MPTRSETDRYKWPDDELHLTRVEPAAFRGSAHAPEPAVEPTEPPVTNRVTPEPVEPPKRAETPTPEPVEPPERVDAPAPDPVEPPEAREIAAPEPVAIPERPEVFAPEPVEAPAARTAAEPPPAIDLFAVARERLNPLDQPRRR